MLILCTSCKHLHAPQSRTERKQDGVEESVCPKCQTPWYNYLGISRSFRIWKNRQGDIGRATTLV